MGLSLHVSLTSWYALLKQVIHIARAKKAIKCLNCDEIINGKARNALYCCECFRAKYVLYRKRHNHNSKLIKRLISAGLMVYIIRSLNGGLVCRSDCCIHTMRRS